MCWCKIFLRIHAVLNAHTASVVCTAHTACLRSKIRDQCRKCFCCCCCFSCVLTCNYSGGTDGFRVFFSSLVFFRKELYIFWCFRFVDEIDDEFCVCVCALPPVASLISQSHKIIKIFSIKYSRHVMPVNTALNKKKIIYTYK